MLSIALAVSRHHASTVLATVLQHEQTLIYLCTHLPLFQTEVSWSGALLGLCAWHACAIYRTNLMLEDAYDPASPDL